jgi:hypothetical protein
LTVCNELAISSIACLRSPSMLSIRLSGVRGGLWHDPRQPRRLVGSTGVVRAVRVFAARGRSACGRDSSASVPPCDRDIDSYPSER